MGSTSVGATADAGQSLDQKIGRDVDVGQRWLLISKAIYSNDIFQETWSRKNEYNMLLNIIRINEGEKKKKKRRGG